MWLGEFRADGLRWDSTISIRATGWDATASPIPDGWSLLQRVNDAVHALTPPQAARSPKICRRATAHAQTTATGGLGFDTQWDAAFFHPVDDTIVAANDAAPLDDAR